jgi:hypothetical protein
MSLAHFEGCQNDVSTEYAMCIAEAIASIDGDEQTLLYYDMYTLCMERKLFDKANDIVNKLKNYYGGNNA